MHPIVMRPISLAIVASLFGAAPCGDTIAQENKPLQRITATMSFHIAADPATSLVVLDVVVPQTRAARQQILDMRYDPAPATVYDKDGTRYAQFVLRRFEKDVEAAVTVEFDADLPRYDFTTANRNARLRDLAKPEELKQWLVDEAFLESASPGIQAAAGPLRGRTDEATVRRCFDYVLRTLARAPFRGDDLGAAWALANKKGDCSEFSDLFVALCRANGVPARVWHGYWLGATDDTRKHARAEVYLSPLGWVPFDPFHARLRTAGTTFADLPAAGFVFLDHHRTSAVLRNGHYWTYRYEGPAAIRVRDEFRFSSRAAAPAKQPK